MNYNELTGQNEVEFADMPPGQFLLGQLSSFDNRFQACADFYFKEITWRQFFAVVCIKVCGGNPTINELSEVMGSSHQNVKQILLKLEKMGFVEMTPDDKDRRKLRVHISEKGMEFCNEHDMEGLVLIDRMSEGISKEEFMVTIKVIAMMDANIKKMYANDKES